MKDEFGADRDAMIEFKAECGHLLTAPEDAAGGYVQCQVCGRMAPVPMNQPVDLSYLFRDVATPPEAKRRSRWLFLKPKRPNIWWYVVAIALRIGYLAALIAVIVVIGRKFIMPMFDPEERARRLAIGTPGTVEATATSPDRGLPGPRGLIGGDHIEGLYVASLPEAAAVLVVEQKFAPSLGSVLRLPKYLRFPANGPAERVPDGTYFIEVALSLDDPRLSSPQLPGYQRFQQLRHALAAADVATRSALVREYFVPDEASAVFCDDSLSPTTVVRQYANIPVTGGRSPGVRALFLPRLGGDQQSRFSFEPLLHGYLPETESYVLDVLQADAEISRFNISAADREWMLRALRRTGILSHPMSDGNIRVFSVGIHDGVVSSRLAGAIRP